MKNTGITLVALAGLFLSACGGMQSELQGRNELPSNDEAQTFKLENTSAILEAARKIEHQTGPYYRAEGTLTCTVMVMEWTPGYPSISDCEISMNGESMNVKSPDNIIKELQERVPMTGPSYYVEVDFTATSISSEFPPYGTEQSVVVKLKK